VLDLLGGREHAQASEKLIGVGIVAALPTAVTGASDWADAEASDDATRRTGIVHAVANSTALALYGASLLARRGGRWAGGARLSAVGALAMGVGAYLGGHISYARGVGVDRTLYDPGPDDDEWHAAIDASLLAEGQPEPSLVRDVHWARWRPVPWSDGERDGALLRFEIRANAFCHQMVRSIVGHLYDVGRGFAAPDSVPAVIAARDRSKVGTVAPPHGLVLWEVGY